MPRTTTFSLVIAGAALAGSGAVRAQDAAQATATTTRGSIVLPVGDKVHGFLRGGETHALLVHLARGDVYSFSVDAHKRGDPLLLHLTFVDPTGREINGDARVVHSADGRKAVVGPYRAPRSGTYSLELSAGSWFSGDYWGTSTVRGARRTIVRLPGNGRTVDVDVAAGSTIRLRSGALTKFTMATPNAPAAAVDGTDPLVASLRGRGLAGAETGTYSFGATGARGATIEIVKPTWKATLVEVPKLPDDPTRLAQFDWMNEWKIPHVPPAMDDVVATPTIGAPVAVGASPTTATAFLGAGIDAANAGYVLNPSTYVPPPQGPADPAITPPADPATLPPEAPPDSSDPTPFGTPTRMTGYPIMPLGQCSALIGKSGFFAGTAGEPVWRDAPWTRSPGMYPQAIADAVLPIGDVLSEAGAPEYGDDSDPYVRVASHVTLQPRDVFAIVEGTITVTARCYVDGHQVRGVLATGGDAVVRWTVSGSGTITDVPFKIDGDWSVTTHLLPLGRDANGNVRPVSLGRGQQCVVEGSETLRVGTVSQTLEVRGFTFNPASDFMYDPLGTVRVVLSAPDQGIWQSFERTFKAGVQTHLRRPVGYKAVEDATTTIDPSTDAQGIRIDDEYMYQIDWCS